MTTIVFPISFRWSILRLWVQSQSPVHSGLSCVNPSNTELMKSRTAISFVLDRIWKVKESVGNKWLKQLCTISFVISICVPVTHPLLTRTFAFFVVDINHRFGLAFRTANGHSAIEGVADVDHTIV